MLRFLLTLLFLSVLCTCVRAQKSEGRDFWFTFLQHRDPDNNKVALISAREATTGTISIPGVNWSRDFSVQANGIVSIPLPVTSETLGSETIRRAAVHLESAGVVSVFIHQYFSFRSEASLVLPTPALGTEYRILAYTGREDANVNYPSTFAIVATEDATEVRITDLQAATEGGRQAGTTITVSLDRGETYQVRAANALLDLTGTRINASAPVAVYAGASWSALPDQNCAAFDNLLEGQFPVSQWGREYLGIPTFRNSGNLYRILAAEDNTTVTVDDGINPFTRTLSAGGFTDFRNGSAVRISASKPILVGEYLLGNQCNGHPVARFGDPSFFLLNEITQTVDTVTVFSSNLQDISENYLNIMFRAGDEVGIKLDGAPLDASIETAPGGEYAFARVNVSAGSHTITSAGCGVIVTVYGYGEVESYAYSGGAAFRNINANPIVEGGCLNDTIIFATGLDTLRFKHTWTLEDGTVETRAEFPRFYAELGEYPVSLIIHDECLDQRDTSFRNVRVSLRQAVAVSPDVRACVGEEARFTALDLPGARYRWEGPNGFLEESQEIVLRGLTPELAGTYSAVGIISGCETFPETGTLIVDTLPRVNIRSDSSFCPRDPLDFATLDAGDHFAYAWSNGRSGNPLEVKAEGLYEVTVTDERGCRATDSVAIAAFCPLRFYVPNVFSPNQDGVNDEFRVYAQDAEGIRMRVFDRWGNQVFERTEASPAWLGNVDGQDAPVGSYSYFLEVDGFDEAGRFVTRRKSGSVLLVR